MQYARICDTCDGKYIMKKIMDEYNQKNKELESSRKNYVEQLAKIERELLNKKNNEENLGTEVNFMNHLINFN